jgi:hypothetical protein
MRVVSLVILILILGGVAFVFIHEPTRSWVFSSTEEAAFRAQGYRYAESPREALEFFAKAIKARNYKAAARYCSDDYAKTLVKGHNAGSSVGGQLDKIHNMLQEKGFMTPMSLDLVLGMDPFPDTFKVNTDVKEITKGETAQGFFEPEPRRPPSTGRTLKVEEAAGLDQKLFAKFCMMPYSFFGPLEIKKDNKGWKIAFYARPEDCDYFVERYQSYVEGYKAYADTMVNERKLKEDAAQELLDVLRKSR